MLQKSQNKTEGKQEKDKNKQNEKDEKNEGQKKDGEEKKVDEKVDNKNKKKGEKMINEKEIISKYKFKEGSYQIQIRILEGQQLMPKPSKFFFLGKDDACNPQASVTIKEIEKKTGEKKETANPIWNKGFQYKFDNLSINDLETMQIIFKVYDNKSIVDSQVIGWYTLDLQSVYFSYQHEMYMTSLALTDPEDEIEGITGYLKVNMCVLGPEDELPTHDLAWQQSDVSSKECQLVPKQVKQIQQGYQIALDVFRAEHLSPLDAFDLFGGGRSIDAYVLAKYGGEKQQSKVIESLNPEWNQRIYLQTMLPNNLKYLNVKVFDYDLTSSSDLIGSLRIKFEDIIEGTPTPKWANIYGSPLTADSEMAAQMNLYGENLGSHYRGRILYQISRFFNKKPKSMVRDLKFQFPEHPRPNIPTRTYILRVQILEGVEFPEREKAIIHVGMGPYLMKTSGEYNYDLEEDGISIEKGDPRVITKGTDGQANFYERLQDKKVVFPADIEQCPDIIFYFATENEESKRITFQRIPAKDLLCRNSAEYQKVWKPRIIQMKEDLSQNGITDQEFPGFLYVQAALIAFEPPAIKEELSLQAKYSLKSLRFVDAAHFIDRYELIVPSNIFQVDGINFEVRNSVRLNENYIKEQLQKPKNKNNKKNKKKSFGFKYQSNDQYFSQVDYDGGEMVQRKISEEIMPVEYVVMEPKLKNRTKYSISFRVVQKGINDLCEIGQKDILGSDDDEDYSPQRDFYTINSDQKYYSKSLIKMMERDQQQSFSFEKDDIIKLDLELNSEHSSITFTKYKSYQDLKNFQGKIVVKFKPNFRQMDLFIVVGMNRETTEIQFLYNHLDDQGQNYYQSVKKLHTSQEPQQQALLEQSRVNNQQTLLEKIPKEFLRQEKEIQLQKNFIEVPSYKQDSTTYELRVFLYHGRDLPATDKNGASDPFVKFKCAGRSKNSKTCYNTLNPGWYETISFDVDLNLNSSVNPGMLITCYDQDFESDELELQLEGVKNNDENQNKEGNNSNLELADIIGRKWIDFQFEHKICDIPQNGCFVQPLVNQNVVIEHGQTIYLKNKYERVKMLEQKEVRYICPISQPIVIKKYTQQDNKYYQFKIQSLGESKELAIGICFLDKEFEQKKKNQGFVKPIKKDQPGFFSSLFSSSKKIKQNQIYGLQANGKVIFENNEVRKFQKNAKNLQYLKSQDENERNFMNFEAQDIVELKVHRNQVFYWKKGENSGKDLSLEQRQKLEQEYLNMEDSECSDEDIQVFKMVPVTFRVISKSKGVINENIYYFPFDAKFGDMYVSVFLPGANEGKTDVVNFIDFNDRQEQISLQAMKDLNNIIDDNKMNSQLKGKKTKIYFSRPQSYKIKYEPTNQMTGEILLGYALVEKKYAEYFPIQPIKPLTVQKPLTLLFIGLRDIAENHPQIDEIKKISASFDISGDNYDPFETEPEQVQNRGANTNQLITLEIDMPFIQQFAPIMDIFAWENSRDEKHILGYCSLPLSEFFEEMYKDQNKGEIQFEDSFGKSQNDNQEKMTIQKTKTKSLFAEEDQQDSLVIPLEEQSYYEQRLDSQQNTNERMLQVQPVDIGEIKNFQLIDIDALNEQTLRDRQQLGNKIQYKQLFAAKNTYYDSNYDGKQKIEKEEENKENKNQQLQLQQLPPNQEKEKLIQNKNKEQQEIQIQGQIQNKYQNQNQNQIQNKDQIQNQQQKQEEQEKQGNQQIQQQIKNLSKEQNLKMFEEEIQEKKLTDLSQIKRKNVKLKSLTKDLKQKYGDNKKQIDEGLEKIDQKMQMKLDPLLALQQAKEVKKISLDVFQFTDIETGNIIFFQLKQEKVEKKGKPTEETTYNLYCWVMYAKQDQNVDQQIYDQQNAQKIFLVKHSKPTGRTNFDDKIRGTVEIKYRQFIKEKLIQCCETAGIEYQESNAQFSSKAKNKAVFLEDSNQLAQIQLDFPNKSDLKLAMLEPKLEQGFEYEVTFKIQNLASNYIAFGVCHAGVKPEADFTGNNIGHKTYMITSNGKMFHNLNQGINNQKNKQLQLILKNGLAFSTGDTIIIKVDSLLKLVTFIIKRVGEEQELSIEQEIIYDKNAGKVQKRGQKKQIERNLYFCVGMNNSGDSISLESVQEVKLDKQDFNKYKKDIEKLKKEKQDLIKKRQNNFFNMIKNTKNNLSKKTNSLFKKHIKKLIAKDKKMIQVDYDTDEEEDYSIQPEWIENREIFNDELEDFIKPNKYLRKIPLSIGSTRKELKENLVSQMLGYEEQEAQITGQLKFIALKSKGEDYKSLYKYKQEVELQKKKMIGESYTCRIYVTRGIHVGGEGNIQDLFLQMKVDGQNLDTWNETLKQKHLKKDTNNPDFYVSYDFDVVLPGSAILTLQVWSDQMALFGGDELVGQTKIDIEDRYFSDKWNAINKACYSQQKEKKFKMPMEQRNLVLPDTAGSVGRLECWIEVIPKKDLKFNAPLYIFPPPQYEFELRVIVWSTRNCVFKDEFEECNDVYVKGGLAKGSENQETDIHWRCRNKGNFNYRMKFKVKYPMVSEDDYGNDKFQVSIWDKDILGADELIGEQTINLNYHQLINKAVVRDKKTQMRTALYTEEDGVIAPFVSDKKKQKEEQDKKKEDNNVIFVDKDGNSVTTTNRIWFEVFNTFANLDEDGDVIENAVNIPQGEVELSFELVPLAIAAEEQNALGRNAPNQFPFLPEPAGRFSFDILHPCDFLKEIIGPNNYRKMWIIICTVFILTFLIWFGIVFFNNYIAVWAAK